ncbi:MAG: GntR family transcriptional regulator [Gemmataceae bacterium]|nr:GntR family transcriptional regulator [Gemmataceae bacterium]
MSKPTKLEATPGSVERIARPLSLVAQVEQILRDAIASGRFPGDRLPTEVELAEQLGVSRETVRRACEALQTQGLLIKFRRKGTFTRFPGLSLEVKATESTLLAYLQADYRDAQGREEAATRAISGLMCQGAIEAAGEAGFELVVRRAPTMQMGGVFRRLSQTTRLRGVIFASFGEEKLLRRVTEFGLPTVLLDHDLHLPQVSSVRDDSFAGARQAVEYLATLEHRRVAFADWHRTDLNPWRLGGYRQGLRDAGLPRRRTWELQSELTEAGGRHVVEELWKLTPRPTALLCFNNTLARHVIEELQRRGLRVPQDLSVMGSGGEQVSGLTGMEADWFQMGVQSVQVLVRHLAADSKQAPEHILAPHALRVGQTTAPPAR